MQKIRHATVQDIPVILEIFDAARAFMRQNGNFEQWTGNYPAESDIVSDIELGEEYVIEDDGVVCAAFTMMSRPEPTYEIIEGKWLQNGPYGTIHRVASSGKCRGCMQMAVEYALQFHSVLRCDTHQVNLPMRNALTRAGFVYCGTVYMLDGSPRMAFERV